MLGEQFWNRYMDKLYDPVISKMRPYLAMLEEIVQAVTVAQLPPESLIVDVGCGTGIPASILLNLAPRSTRLVGYDRSQQALDVARRKFQDDPRVIFEEYDLGGGIPLQSNCADLVVSINVLYTQHDPESLIRDMVRVMKVGGAIAIANLYRADVAAVFNAQAEWYARETDAELKRDWDEVKPLLAEFVEANRIIAMTSTEKISLISLDELKLCFERAECEVVYSNDAAYAGTDVLICGRRLR